MYRDCSLILLCVCIFINKYKVTCPDKKIKITQSELFHIHSNYNIALTITSRSLKCLHTGGVNRLSFPFVVHKRDSSHLKKYPPPPPKTSLVSASQRSSTFVPHVTNTASIKRELAILISLLWIHGLCELALQATRGFRIYRMVYGRRGQRSDLDVHGNLCPGKWGWVSHKCQESTVFFRRHTAIVVVVVAVAMMMMMAVATSVCYAMIW